MQSKSVETLDPRSGAALGPRDKCRGPLDNVTYQGCERRSFFKVFPIISLWELYVAKLTRVPIQTAQKPDATVSLCLMMLFMKFDQNWPGR